MLITPEERRKVALPNSSRTLKRGNTHNGYLDAHIDTKLVLGAVGVSWVQGCCGGCIGGCVDVAVGGVVDGLIEQPECLIEGVVVVNAFLGGGHEDFSDLGVCHVRCCAGGLRAYLLLHRQM